MVPNLQNSEFTLCELFCNIVDISRTICNLVLPSGGSKLPAVVGIQLKNCYKTKYLITFIIFLGNVLSTFISTLEKTKTDKTAARDGLSIPREFNLFL